ncbi:hypothetical protein [Halomarina rubra]|uniref:Uncharacterized protein n=1 Tax=Halomarina rubra TaxID=2071873 RepID=A0ABD6AVQ9_9EURY|nr:hypothetical protein [Halomarina rubra]
MGGFQNGLITNTDQYPAQRLSSAIERFVSEFGDRNSLGRLVDVVDTSTQLTRGIVEQRPETFTEKHLVVPGLKALGYSIHRERPGEYTATGRSEPDFSIETPHAQNPYIVEAKRIGNLPQSVLPDDGEGSEQLQSYLEEGFSAKYRTDLDRRHLVGIATDGIYWLVFKKDLETGAIDRIGGASTESAVLETVKAHRHPEEVSEQWRVDVRRRLEVEFVPELSAENVAAAVEEIE